MSSRSSSPAIARPTTSSECPKPYCAAVSIQFTPSSSAWWIAAIDSSSSWAPQLHSKPPPPSAQAPKPTRVISIPVEPSSVVLTRETLRSQEGEDGEHAAVILGRRREVELAEDARHVLLDGALGDDEALCDRLVRASFRHQLEHLALARRQRLDGIVPAPPAHELR